MHGSAHSEPEPHGGAVEDGDGRDLPAYYWLENVELTTVGIDVGSATTHMIFSRIHMKREGGELSGRFAVVSRDELWKSPIILTPYSRDGLVDARTVSSFVARSYSEAGLASSEIDTGAVILTGEALKRANARALADELADDAGRFVCVTAGHALEGTLGALGAVGATGAGAGRRTLCVDIGGGTTKIAVVECGTVTEVSAWDIGARMLTWDEDRRITSVRVNAGSSRLTELRVGQYLSAEQEEAIADESAALLVRLINGQWHEVPRSMALTAVPARRDSGDVDALVCAGGVAEYVYGREQRSFGDLGRALGRSLRQALDRAGWGGRLAEAPQGIRATVVGVSQYAVQVSGSTVFISPDARLPLRNIPVSEVVTVDGEEVDSIALAGEIREAIRVADGAADSPAALMIDFSGVPAYERISRLAAAIHAVSEERADWTHCVVIISGDIAASLGEMLCREFHFKHPLVCLDNIDMKPLDFADIGQPVGAVKVVPVVIKSLLFSGTEKVRDMKEKWS